MMKDMKSTPYYIYILMALSLLMAACDNYDISTSGKSQLVVEGWIDAGHFPIVKLTKTVPLTEERIDVDDLSKYVENWSQATMVSMHEIITIRAFFQPRRMKRKIRTARYRGYQISLSENTLHIISVNVLWREFMPRVAALSMFSRWFQSVRPAMLSIMRL